MQSSASQETSQRKRAPAWSNNEVLDLIAIWGEESVMLELRNNKRNANTFARVSKAMLERGHNRDAQQCRVKIKELRQAFQKAKEANGHSGGPRWTCKFYNELNQIMGGTPTTIAPLYVESTSTEGIIIRPGEDLDDEDEDEEGNSSELQEATGETLLADSQELFVTLEPVPSQSSQGGAPGGEGTSGDQTWVHPSRPPVARAKRLLPRKMEDFPRQPSARDFWAFGLKFVVHSAQLSQSPPSCPSRRLVQIRKRKKKTCDEMFNELLQNSHAESARQTEWRERLLQSTMKARVVAEKQEQQRLEREQRMQEREEMRMDAFLQVMENQSDMLWCLVKLHQDERSPLQPLSNHLPKSHSFPTQMRGENPEGRAPGD